jgi:hypothetical protein
MVFCCPGCKKWQRLPTATALVFMLAVGPAAVFLAGGVFLPATLILRDACGSTETLLDNVSGRPVGAPWAFPRRGHAWPAARSCVPPSVIVCFPGGGGAACGCEALVAATASRTHAPHPSYVIAGCMHAWYVLTWCEHVWCVLAWCGPHGVCACACVRACVCVWVQIVTGSHGRICRDILGGTPDVAASSPQYMAARNASLFEVLFPQNDPFELIQYNYTAPGAPNTTALLAAIAAGPVCSLNVYGHNLTLSLPRLLRSIAGSCGPLTVNFVGA